MAWGYSMLLDGYGCDPTKIRGYTNIQRFAKELVEEIDMISYGEPVIHHFGYGDKEGYTMVQLIETSNIVAHFSNDTNTMFLDVFSCKAFDYSKVVHCAEKFFGGPSFRVHYNVEERGLDL